MKNYKLLKFLIGLSGIALHTVTMAEGVIFVPRVSLAVSDYTFTQKERPQAGFPEVEFDVRFKMLGVGTTIVYDKFYLDLFGQHSTDESDTFKDVITEKFTGDRKDYTISLGMKVLDNKGAVYVGYKLGKSEADSNLGTTLEFEEDGFFIGANYGWVIADTGVLSLNVAIAKLDGQLKETIKAPHPFAGVGLDIDASSKATGISYGIAWSSKLLGKWGYSIGVDVNNYTFDHVKDDDAGFPPSDEFEEDFITAKVSISYAF